MSATAFTLPADHAERVLALDPRRSFIVRAPAGSGKTELLIQRYLSLLAHVESPESVLAITFTRKAAGEMRARVLDALRAAASSDGEPGSGNEAVTRQLARAVLERDARHQWNLQAAPARLRIETIDALCSAIVRRMPWLARFGSMPGLLEDASELYDEAARNTILLLADPGYAAAIEKLVLHLDNDLARAQQLLVAMLEKREQWLRHLGAGASDPRLRASLESTLAAIVTSSLEQLLAVFPEQLAGDLVLLARFAAHNLSRSNPEHTVTRLASLASLPDARPEDLEKWLAVADFLLTNTGDWRRAADRRLGFPTDQKQRKREFTHLLDQLAGAEGLLERLLELRHLPSPRYSDRQWAFLEALFDILPAAAAELKIVFQKRGMVDFAELAQAAQRALGTASDPTDLALAFGHRIEHILVDEVQDTSVTQVRMLESLIAGWDPGDGRTLFLVGDPMQSIYKFREAEVGLFLKIRRDGLPNLAPEPIALRVNFRSRPGIVHWVNERLSVTFPAAEDALSGAVAYSPSASHRTPSAHEAVSVHPLAAEDADAEARLVTDLVDDARRDFPEGSVAILVRARTHLPAIVAELNRRGLRFRAVEIDLLAERPVVRDLVALTRALLHPADRTAWLALLRAPWCGLTLEELYRIASADSSAPIWDLLPVAPSLDHFHGVMSRALESVRRVPLYECVDRAWIALGGPCCLAETRDLADARRFLSLLNELDVGGGIDDLERLENRVASLFADPDSAASDQLQVMTIHKAKGLQFDVVIVPGLGYAAGRDAEPLLRWAEVPTPRGMELLFAPVESAEDEQDPTCRYLRWLDRRKTEQESVRLLYVAATRARERLHLVGHANDGRPRAGSLLECLWPVAEPFFAAATKSSAAHPEAPARVRSIHRLPAGWQAPTPPAPVAWQPETIAEPAAEPIAFEWVGDTLRLVGIVVHAWLERIARDGLDQWSGERVTEDEPTIRTAIASLGTPPDEIEAAVARVERALRATLGDPRGRWILARRPIEACEYSAVVAEGNTTRQLVVDRTFVDEDNVRWVVDYKTSDHSGGGLDAFLNSELERYRNQLESYARLFTRIESRHVRCALYFPLLSAWREL